MRRLLDFLLRHRLLLVFLLLQAISIYLTLRQKAYQRSQFFSTSQEITGTIHSWRSYVADFFSLREQNKQLIEENARLRSSLKGSYFELYSSSETEVDTLLERRYTFYPAKVINLSFTRRDNLLTINKGRVHGMKSGMGVINHEGVVGAIKNCSEHFSTVVPLLHSRFSTSGQIGQTSFFGTVRWSGSDYRYAQLEDVPIQAQIQEGDTVFSTSFSGVFPPKIPIGIVESINSFQDELFKSAKLKLQTDFSRLHYVEVVSNSLYEERDSLELEESLQ
jgi:rod shape-determining protein MreC